LKTSVPPNDEALQSWPQVPQLFGSVAVVVQYVGPPVVEHDIVPEGQAQRPPTHAYPAQHGPVELQPALTAPHVAGVQTACAPADGATQAVPAQHCDCEAQAAPAGLQIVVESQRFPMHVSPVQHGAEGLQACRRREHAGATSTMSIPGGTSTMSIGVGTSIPVSIASGSDPSIASIPSARKTSDLVSATSGETRSVAMSAPSIAALVSVRASRSCVCNPSHGMPHAESTIAKSGHASLLATRCRRGFAIGPSPR
jgi:hypothetical protein